MEEQGVEALVSLKWNVIHFAVVVRLYYRYFLSLSTVVDNNTKINVVCISLNAEFPKLLLHVHVTVC